MYHIIEKKGITSMGRVATSGAHTSGVREAPVGTNMVLTCTKYKSFMNKKLQVFPTSFFQVLNFIL